MVERETCWWSNKIFNSAFVATLIATHCHSSLLSQDLIWAILFRHFCHDLECEKILAVKDCRINLIYMSILIAITVINNITCDLLTTFTSKHNPSQVLLAEQIPTPCDVHGGWFIIYSWHFFALVSMTSKFLLTKILSILSCFWWEEKSIKSVN
jgi:hypothetical protein